MQRKKVAREHRNFVRSPLRLQRAAAIQAISKYPLSRKQNKEIRALALQRTYEKHESGACWMSGRKAVRIGETDMIPSAFPDFDKIQVRACAALLPSSVCPCQGEYRALSDEMGVKFLTDQDYVSEVAEPGALRLFNMDDIKDGSETTKFVHVNGLEHINDAMREQLCCPANDDYDVDYSCALRVNHWTYQSIMDWVWCPPLPLAIGCCGWPEQSQREEASLHPHRVVGRHEGGAPGPQLRHVGDRDDGGRGPLPRRLLHVSARPLLFVCVCALFALCLQLFVKQL